MPTVNQTHSPSVSRELLDLEDEGLVSFVFYFLIFLQGTKRTILY